MDHLRVTVSLNQCLASLDKRSIVLLKNVLGCSDFRGPFLLRSAQLCGPSGYPVIARISMISWLVHVWWGSDPAYFFGGGIVFLKLPLMFIQSFAPFLPPFLLLSLSPPPAFLPWVLESTFAIFMFALGWALRFISCFNVFGDFVCLFVCLILFFTFSLWESPRFDLRF